MDHLPAAGSSATHNLTNTEPPGPLNRRKTVDFRFQRPNSTSGSFFFDKWMRAMDSRHDFTLEKVFWGYFGALDQKANSALQARGTVTATQPTAASAAGIQATFICVGFFGLAYTKERN